MFAMYRPLSPPMRRGQVMRKRTKPKRFCPL
uniref:Uncharacterized protein n=1 Tax=virus sp. ct1Hk25 TaxID=2825803 RepID=A0A8S5RNZ2_9VIRU|nr:MAG TPA: hypothetical protein [virus sp. ct1Hk25]DAV77842.1 MAG TPA: hypothetical protein [Bacteriophage sp.]